MAGLGGFSVGDRVELHPGLDRWMMGDRFGQVARIGRSKVHVKLDRSGKTIGYPPSRLTRIY